MQLTSRFRIKNINTIANFLNEVHVGRLATIDENGYPQVIPMNFVHLMTTTNTTNQNDKYIDMSSSNENQRHQQKATNDINIRNSKSGSDTAENECIQTCKHMIYMHSHHKGGSHVFKTTIDA